MQSICIDARMIDHSGIGTYIQNLILVLLQRPLKIIVIAHPKHLMKHKWLNQTQVIFSRAKIYSFSEQLMYLMKIPKCDIFLSPHFNIPIFPIRAKKLIVVIHDVYHLAHKEELNFMKRRYAEFFYYKALSKANTVITVSNFSFSEIMRFFPQFAKKVHVAPLGVDFEFFTSEKKEDECKELLRKYQLPRTFLLYVGSVKPHKNLSSVLKAYQLFSKKKNMSLVLLGVSNDEFEKIYISKIKWDNPGCIKSIYCLKNIKNHEVSKLYQIAQVLVFPSLYEGFGFPPLEAMSCGCPVITSNKASIPEVCGNAAFYTDPYDYTQMAEDMIYLSNSHQLRKDLVERGAKRVQDFNWSQAIEKQLELIKSKS